MNAFRLLPLVALFPVAAMAGSASDNFQVTLDITGACSLVANDLDFGSNEGAITSEILAQSSLVASCTNGNPYSIGLNNGDGAGASASSRKMTNSADNSTVNYSLYVLPARSTVWDNNCTALPSTAANCYNDVGNLEAANETIPVYGRVFAGQNNVTIGRYADTVVATLTF